jgi:hypothetical protein
LDQQIRRDMEALASTTADGLPKIEQTVRALTTAPARETREGWWMKALQGMQKRPWFVTAVGAGVVALVLLVVPISYDRLTGYDVVITVPGMDALGDPGRIDRMAEDLGAMFATRNISVSKDTGSNSAQVQVQIPVGPKGTVEHKAQAFTRALQEHGWTVASEVRPRTERVFGSMLAYAADQVVEIRINAEGKSEQEIEEEVRAQLMNAGFTNPTVDVTKQGDETRIQISEYREGDTGENVPSLPLPQLVLDGQPVQNPVQVRVERQGTPISDDELREEVRRQLREQGVEADVVVENGRVVSITPRR